MHISIIGCGYLGQRLARLYLSQASSVHAIVRSSASQQQLQQLGINAQALDLDQDIELENFRADVLYYLAAPPSQGQTDPRLKRLLADLNPAHIGKIILVSTTGVYGDCQGAWITEEQALNPQTDRAHRRIDAERQLQDWAQAQQCRWQILRVPGIYGPHRLPLKRLQQNIPMLAPEFAPYSNRIHIDDLANACHAAANCPHDGIIHLSDGNPSTMTDYFYRVADAYQLPRPAALTLAQAQQQLSAEMLSYLNESKRLDISRMQAWLNIEIRYPDLKTGLAQCIKEEQEH